MALYLAVLSMLGHQIGEAAYGTPGRSVHVPLRECLRRWNDNAWVCLRSSSSGKGGEAIEAVATQLRGGWGGSGDNDYELSKWQKGKAQNDLNDHRYEDEYGYPGAASLPGSRSPYEGEMYVKRARLSERRRQRAYRDDGDGAILRTAVRANLSQGNRKWGIVSVVTSLVLTIMGIILFFNKTLVRVGNIAFVLGVALLIGPSQVLQYFSRRTKLRGTSIFMLGFFLVFTGHPIIGLLMEVFGFLNLFGNLLPIFGAIAKRLVVFMHATPRGSLSLTSHHSMPIVRNVWPEARGREYNRQATRQTRPPKGRRQQKWQGYEQEPYEYGDSYNDYRQI